VDYEPWLYAIVVAGAFLLALFLLYVMKTRGKKEEPSENSPAVEEKLPPSKVEQSVTNVEAKSARDELRTLDLEREILSFAIRRLYEAHAEGKITEDERERLALSYKTRIAELKETISRNESLVALHELEAMRGDLLKLFSERFDEVNGKIEEIRSRIGIKPVIEEPTPPPAPPVKEKRRVRRTARPPVKTEAEKRIEEIKAEVEKVLDRLGQIEVEA